MELLKVPRRWVIAVAALAAFSVATACQPAAAQDKPAAQEKPAQKADQPAAPQQAEKVLQAKQPEPTAPVKSDGKPETVVVPGKRAVVRPGDGEAQVRTKEGTPAPSVQLKPGEVPAVKFDTPVYDFGRVKAGTEIEHDFWFTNTGNGPLEIIKVKPS